MKSFLIVCILSAFIFPVVNSVTIVKSEITSNRPFAGVINDNTVGTTLCCDYWLRPDSMPETATYTILTTPFASLMGFATVINH